MMSIKRLEEIRGAHARAMAGGDGHPSSGLSVDALLHRGELLEYVDALLEENMRILLAVNESMKAINGAIQREHK